MSEFCASLTEKIDHNFHALQEHNSLPCSTTIPAQLVKETTPKAIHFRLIQSHKQTHSYKKRITPSDFN